MPKCVRLALGFWGQPFVFSFSERIGYNKSSVDIGGDASSSLFAEGGGGEGGGNMVMFAQRCM